MKRRVRFPAVDERDLKIFMTAIGWKERSAFQLWWRELRAAVEKGEGRPWRKGRGGHGEIERHDG